MNKVSFTLKHTIVGIYKSHRNKINSKKNNNGKERKQKERNQDNNWLECHNSTSLQF